MADAAHDATDDKLSEMEKHLTQIYSRAQTEVQKTADKYFRKFEDADKRKQKQVEDGTLTEKEYKQWRENKILYSKRFEDLQSQISAQLLNVNQTAIAYINGNLPDVYALNYNAFPDTVQGDLGGYSFTLTDANTVKKLATEDKTLLPYKTVDGKRDVRWNTKKINAEVLQGILQGDSIPKIAKRMQNVTEMNRVSAVRNARTTITSAENRGRLDSYRQAEKDGVILQKEWMSTLDGRTRHAHRLLNGKTADVDKPFESDMGDIMFPGDPEADPANVYNCRCTMVQKFIGFKKLTRKDLPQQEEPQQVTVVTGKDRLSDWTRRPDKFDFEIEDIINAQGFDGLPRIVDADEFEKAVKESRFIAQRTYSAPSQEILEEYRKQLYGGKWYVDCSTGGAQYGQGMYCAADWSGNLTEGVNAEMLHYRMLNQERGFNFSRIETLTLDKSAKIVKFDEIQAKYTRATDEKFIMSKIAEASKFSETEEAILHREILRDASRSELQLARKLESEDGETYDRITEEINEKLQKELREKYNIEKLKDMDLGSYAALLGYDAIDAEGHGLSGSYTVILNRTKVIFKKGD